ncbi:MAG: hypothetical protein HQM13_17725 [SAR324 cluster bacterium]|nr:hypothetical protein [SAR324 cluster bacterium]
MIGILLALLVYAPASAQDIQTPSPQIRLNLNVGGHDVLKNLLHHLFKKELGLLKGVIFVEKFPAFQIKVDGMQTDSQGFAVSIIVLDPNGMYLANDIGYGTNLTELKEIAQKISSQIDKIYLSPMRIPEKVASTSSEEYRKKNDSVPSFTSLGAHWIMEKLEGGRFIKLEDDSLWEISSYGRSNSQLWLPYEEVFILETDDDEYPYQIMNKINEDTASAKLIEEQ